jgi:hypothetical protein
VEGHEGGRDSGVVEGGRREGERTEAAGSRERGLRFLRIDALFRKGRCLVLGPNNSGERDGGPPTESERERGETDGSDFATAEHRQPPFTFALYLHSAAAPGPVMSSLQEQRR